MQIDNREAQFAEKYGAMPPVEREGALAREIRRWAGGHKVYCVGTERQLLQMHGPEFNKSRFKIVARVPVPRPPDSDKPLRPGPPRTFHYLRNEKDLVIAEWINKPTRPTQKGGG